MTQLRKAIRHENHNNAMPLFHISGLAVGNSAVINLRVIHLSAVILRYQIVFHT